MKRNALIAVIAAAAALAAYAAYGRLYRGMDSYEAVRKLQGLRLAVELFRQGTGRLPSGMDEVIRGGYLEAVPVIKLKRHRAHSSVRNAPGPDISDTGGWLYVAAPESPYFGRVVIDCSHKDDKGRDWSGF